MPSSETWVREDPLCRDKATSAWPWGCRAGTPTPGRLHGDGVRISSTQEQGGAEQAPTGQGLVVRVFEAVCHHVGALPAVLTLSGVRRVGVRCALTPRTVPYHNWNVSLQSGNPRVLF